MLDIKEQLKTIFTLLFNNIQALGIPEDYLQMIDFDKIERDLLNNSKNDVKKLLQDDLEDIVNRNFAIEFGKLMVGNNCNLKKMLLLESDNKIDISLSGNDYDDKYNEYQNVLGENIEILDTLKQLYDCIFLKKLFNENQNIYISSLMVKYYNQHREDLNFLKGLFKSNRGLYNKLFRSGKDLCIYDKYITNKIDSEEFKKEINKLLVDLFDSDEKNINQNLIDEYTLNVKEKIENGEFLPKITTTDNGKYPYQLNKVELIKIIENQGKYYPFLLEQINDNKTYKIVKLLEFKIPYYVGPLVSSKRSNNAWLERKIDDVKITPYNFDEVVNKEDTAEKFIRRMISHCSYLLNEYALANNSI